MQRTLNLPIGLLDEHPHWSDRLIAEFHRRGLPFEKIDVSDHVFWPAVRDRRYSVLVNRVSPSAHTRGHASSLCYALQALTYFEEIGIPVINPAASYRYEASKAAQALLMERLGLRYPRCAVLNQLGRILDLLPAFRFPVIVKPNVGGSGAGIVRFDRPEDLEEAVKRKALSLGPDGTALLQEYLESEDGSIVRVEVLGGEFLYAIRITTDPMAGFNLCPADLCQLEGRADSAAPAALGACPAEISPAVARQVEKFDPPPSVIADVLRLTREAHIDIGGVEYLRYKGDGQIYYYDMNALSNFVADAPALLGFDPTRRFADFIVAVATGAAEPASRSTGRVQTPPRR
ncbi:MAG: ATP-grasp domain-containing protein [Candidatus Methylomirabilales bacterium]